MFRCTAFLNESLKYIQIMYTKTKVEFAENNNKKGQRRSEMQYAIKRSLYINKWLS